MNTPDGFDGYDHSDVPLRMANTYTPNVLQNRLRREGVISRGEIGIGTQPGLIMRDTFFSRELTTWVKNQHYGFDKAVLDEMNEIVLANIKKMTAIQMCLDDLGNSITELGLDINMDNYKKLLDELGALLALDTLRRACDLLGLSDYRDEIVLREIDKEFGTAQWKASRDRAEQGKREALEVSKVNSINSITTVLEELMQKVRGMTRPQAAPHVNRHTEPKRAQRDREEASQARVDRETDKMTQQFKAVIDEIADQT